MLVVSFWFSFVVDCFCKHVHPKLLQSCLLAAAKVFLLLALGTQAYAVSSPVTTDNASMPLSLVSTQALLISCSAHSAKLPSFQKATAGCPLPTFVVCKKGRYLFLGGTYFRGLTVNCKLIVLLRTSWCNNH